MANGEQPQNVTQAATKVATTMLSVLPPAFAVLVALNVCFLASVLWFFNAQSEQRIALATRMIDSCLVFQAKLAERAP